MYATPADPWRCRSVSRPVVLTHDETVVGERGIHFGFLRQIVFQCFDVFDKAQRLERDRRDWKNA